MGNALTITQIGPSSHGTRMSLEEFARVEGQAGYIYELEKGLIVVVDVPGLLHGLVLQAIRDAFTIYRLGHKGAIFLIAGGSESGLRMPELESERHPDLAVYLSPPPVEGDRPWDYWTPDIVVEIVSESSADRDYQIKREEYLRAGVRLYWIVDPGKRMVTALTRRGDTWAEQRLDASAALATALLPGLAVKIADLFAAAG